jgi:hypothetical protein
LVWAIPSLTHHYAGLIFVCNKYFAGGPRLPNTFMVIMVGDLQCGQQLSLVPFIAFGSMLFFACNSFSFSLFHVLLSMP